MPRTPINNIVGALKSVTLTPLAREQLRETLMSYADLHQTRQKPHVSAFSSARFLSYIIHRRVAVGFSLALLFVLIGGPVAEAAYASRPGDPLYELRLSVVEPIATAFIPEAVGRARWHAVLAEQRIEDAVYAAEKGILNEQLALKLDAELETQIRYFNTYTTMLRDEGRMQDAIKSRAEFEARLSTKRESVATAAKKAKERSDTKAAGALSEVAARAGIQEEPAQIIELAPTQPKPAPNTSLKPKVFDTPKKVIEDVAATTPEIEKTDKRTSVRDTVKKAFPLKEEKEKENRQKEEQEEAGTQKEKEEDEGLLPFLRL